MKEKKISEDWLATIIGLAIIILAILGLLSPKIFAF